MNPSEAELKPFIPLLLPAPLQHKRLDPWIGVCVSQMVVLPIALWLFHWIYADSLDSHYARRILYGIGGILLIFGITALHLLIYIARRRINRAKENKTTEEIIDRELSLCETTEIPILAVVEMNSAQESHAPVLDYATPPAFTKPGTPRNLPIHAFLLGLYLALPIQILGSAFIVPGLVNGHNDSQIIKTWLISFCAYWISFCVIASTRGKRRTEADELLIIFGFWILFFIAHIVLSLVRWWIVGYMGWHLYEW